MPVAGTFSSSSMLAAAAAPFLGTESIGVIPFSKSYCLSMATSALSFSIISCISLGERMTFAAVLFLIFLAREANCRVCTDSSRCLSCLLAVQISVVFEFPPRASFRKSVSLESLNGM